MKKRANLLILALFIILINIGCDQSTKEYARKNLKYQGTVKVIDNFFDLHYTENSGGFLSIGSNLPQPFKIILLTFLPAVLVIGLSLFLIFNKKLSLPQIIGLSCMVGGGASNIFDRIFHNSLVTDFMIFKINNIQTGILNFADLSITFGALFLLISQFIQMKKLQKNENS